MWKIMNKEKLLKDYDYFADQIEEQEDFYKRLQKFRFSSKHRFFDFTKFKPLELKAMRYLRGEKPHTFFKKIGGLDSYENPEEYEYVPEDIAEKYVMELGIIHSEYKRIQALINGDTETYEQQRKIPKTVYNNVLKRDNYKCTKCGSINKLHLHHIKHFSKGGLHHPDNLITLCAPCHTEEHKGDRGYHAMKATFGRD